jgi:hypothetical protein
MSLTIPELQALARAAGFPPTASVDGQTFDIPALAAAVAMAESGGDPNAYGDAQYGGSIGLWQVNLPAHPSYTAAELYDPATNAAAAYAISSGGTNWQPWTTYREGLYKPYYQPSAAASSTLATVGKVLGVVAVVAGAGLGLAYEGLLPEGAMRLARPVFRWFARTDEALR